MRAAVIQASNAQDPAAAVRFVTDWPDPTAPTTGQVLIRTRCSALNHLDLWMAKGMMGAHIKYPAISGSDACGVVEAVGPGVDAAWVGRRVIVNAAVDVDEVPRPDDPPEIETPNFRMIGEHFAGMHAELFLAPAANLATVADTCGDEHAAAFALSHLTAYSMMVGKAGLRPGQSVLITGIGGGVALAALLLAKYLGCFAIVTSRSQAKLDLARGLGADAGVLDDGTDWFKQIRTLTSKRGVDLAVDSSGKATHLNAVRSLCRGGVYASCGATSGPDATTDLTRLFWMQLRFVGSTMANNSEFHQVAALLNNGAITPVLDQVFKADRFADGARRLASAEQFGKVVIDWR